MTANEGQGVIANDATSYGHDELQASRHPEWTLGSKQKNLHGQQSLPSNAWRRHRLEDFMCTAVQKSVDCADPYTVIVPVIRI
jgi:hypothetical protein